LVPQIEKVQMKIPEPIHFAAETAARRGSPSDKWESGIKRTTLTRECEIARDNRPNRNLIENLNSSWDPQLSKLR
jgi:hypothetical protein